MALFRFVDAVGGDQPHLREGEGDGAGEEVAEGVGDGLGVGDGAGEEVEEGVGDGDDDSSEEEVTEDVGEGLGSGEGVGLAPAAGPEVEGWVEADEF